MLPKVVGMMVQWSDFSGV